MIDAPLYPPQQAVLEHGIIDLGFSSVLSLPTGAGKTTLAELGMERVLEIGERVAYLTPLKALAEEKITGWRDRWRTHKVGIFTGDYDSSATPVPYRDAEVLVCTYERMDGILRHWQRHLDWLARLGLVVVDEFHLLMDPGRGPRLEGMISRLRRVNPFCRLMGLSATVSNHAELAAWLNGVSYHSSWRPAPLYHEVRRFKRLADKSDLLVGIVAETKGEAGQTLVFASSRRRAEQLAGQVSTAGYSASHHHAGLSLACRRAIEARFRQGTLDCIVSTPTLEMGLNLPCRTVVIADNTRWNGENFAPLPVWNYLQRAGRAGRPGQDGVGRAILLAPVWARELPDYGRATPEPVRSQLRRAVSLAEQILVEVASRSARTRAQLIGSFLPTTLAYRQDPGITENCSDCLADLLTAGMLKEDSTGILHPTAIGWVAVRHQLTPSTAKHLLSLGDLDQEHVLSEFDLILHHCWEAQLQPQLPLYIEAVELLEALIRDIPSHLLDALPPVTLAPRVCAAGVLMAVVAWQFLQGTDLPPTLERLDVYPSDAESLRESLVRLMQASAALHMVTNPATDPDRERQRELLCGPSLPSRLHRLALRLTHGLPADAVYLTLVPGCGGRFARRLWESGITDLEDLCNRERSELAAIPGIGQKRARDWIAAAEGLIKYIEPGSTATRTVRARTIAPPSSWPTDIDPGRLHRATSLQAFGNHPRYRVSGGAEDHLVEGDRCDCADFEQHGPNWWCKHRLAIRLAHQDPLLKTLVQRLSDLRPPPTLAGHLADLALGRRWRHD